MRTVAVGRKAFLFVGSERAGHAAAIYYSIITQHAQNPYFYRAACACTAGNRRMRVKSTPSSSSESSCSVISIDASSRAGHRIGPSPTACTKSPAHFDPRSVP
jgi:hypothetical protein